MYRRKYLNLLNMLYYYVQRCIASSNNTNLDTKIHLSTEIVLPNKRLENFSDKNAIVAKS